ncbi:ComF family protein [Aquincola tertiaricarbonis]|uniref:ComF family protein n=1 Tax=Aquincola tertiaricarbonis TaxID=391953 RepID=A0ABY4SDE1_AQUTE|nr:phosphoribosyltransferase family protein [Aquincola tertiaricarbonis]URI09335.1 ComF family protein [Aquincola tertiaricarbonis]
MKPRLAVRPAPPPARGWPTLCGVCHGWARSRVCAECAARFAAWRPRCGPCGLRVPTGVHTCAECSAQPPPFARTVVVADYGFPWQALIGRFKYREGLDLAGALAALLARAVAEAEAEATEHDATPRLVLPMPLSPARLAERGFNQSAELARRVARVLGLPCADALLRRVADGGHQAGLGKAARQRAVQGCFHVPPERSHPLRSRHLALVDDVVTTGATAAEATRTLLAAGAASVHVWAFARTPPPSDS